MRRAAILQAVACVVTAGCGRVGFDTVTRAPTDATAAADAAPPPDATPAPLALEPGFPLFVNDDTNTGTTITTEKFSTARAGLLFVAVFAWGTGGTDETPLAVTGGGLTWTRQAYSSFPAGSVPPGTSGDEIWTAWAAAPLTDEVITASRGSTVETAVMDLGVYAFDHAQEVIGATGAFASQTGDHPLLVTVDATAAGSWIVGGFHHGTANAVRLPDPDTVFDLTDDPSIAPHGHFQAVGRLATPTTGPGAVTIGSSTPGPYSLTSAIEVLRAP